MLPPSILTLTISIFLYLSLAIAAAVSPTRRDLSPSSPTDSETIPTSITALTVGFVVVGTCSFFAFPLILLFQCFLRRRKDGLSIQRQAARRTIPSRTVSLLSIRQPSRPSPSRTKSMIIRDGKGRSILHWRPDLFVRPAQRPSIPSPPKSAPESGVLDITHRQKPPWLMRELRVANPSALSPTSIITSPISAPIESPLLPPLDLRPAWSGENLYALHSAPVGGSTIPISNRPQGPRPALPTIPPKSSYRYLTSISQDAQPIRVLPRIQLPPLHIPE